MENVIAWRDAAPGRAAGVLVLHKDPLVPPFAVHLIEGSIVAIGPARPTIEEALAAALVVLSAKQRGVAA